MDLASHNSKKSKNFKAWWNLPLHWNLLFQVSQGQDMNFDDAIQLDGDSQIITMSTCMPDNRPDNRWLVMAVLMK